MATDAYREEDVSEHAQALFKELFLASPDAIVVTAPDGRISATNPAVEQLFGYRETELVGQLVEILLPERFRGRHPQHRGGFVAAPSVRPMGTGLDLFGRVKDCTEFPVDIMLSPVRTGADQSVLTVVRDITQRKQTETALRRSEERFRLLVEGAKDYAIFMLDPEGRVATWNSGAERIKGYCASEIIGRHFSSFYTEEDIHDGRPQRLLKQAARDGRIEDEGWRVRKDGSQFWASVTITAVRDATGKLIGFGKVTRDLTERRRTELALRRSEARSHLFIDAVQDYAIFMLDPDGCVSTWNTGAERIKGYKASEIVGQHFSRFYPEEDVRAGKPTWELEVATREGRFEEEGWRVRNDGSRFSANVVITT